MLLSYSRPWNIPGLVANLLRSRSVSRVIVCNNNPEHARYLDRHLSGLDSVELIHRRERTRQGIRLLLAARSQQDIVILVDDDMLLYPDQIDHLVAKCADDPGRPHGFAGEAFATSDSGQFRTMGGDLSPQYPLRVGVTARTSAEVEHLTNAYVLTSELARKAESLARAIGIHDFSAWHNGEDIVMSMCSGDHPVVHNIGNVLVCISDCHPKIATWATAPDFFSERTRIRAKVLTIQEGIGAT